MRLVKGRSGPVAVLLATVLLAAACGESASSGGDGAPSATGSGHSSDIKTGFINLGPDVEPVQGGKLTMATYSEISGLDPAGAVGSGQAGGTELNAIYDVLMRYDPVTKKYEPKLAKSLESDASAKTWTLTLRDGVTFSDGTPFDAKAVAFSINRYVENHGRKATFVKEILASMDTPDARTVVFHLNQTWSLFPWLLSYTPGNIVSPTAAKKSGEEFLRHPVGAGPFVLDRFAPGEEISLTAREDYYDGRPYLDALRFVTIGGAQANLDALNGGQVQLAYLRDPEVFRKAVADQRPGFVTVSNGGGYLLINNGIKGQTSRPGADVRVRQAIVKAIDPEVIDRRAYGAAGLPGSKIFQASSRWSTDTPGPAYDPDGAKLIVNEAKQAGYDGKLNLVSNNTPASSKSALAMQALLNSVGFEVTIDSGNTVQEQIRKVLAGEFDLSTYGANILDEVPWVGLSATFGTGSTGNQAGYSSPKMDQLLVDLGQAADDNARQALIEKIQQQWNDDAPAMFYAAMPEFLAWDSTVHGIVPTTSVELLFDKAFIRK